MPVAFKSPSLQRIGDACLTASVHFDAFMADPRAYMTAAKWWVLRKRVRARGQFAPLLSQSRNAYHLWARRQTRQDLPQIAATATAPIIAIIDTRREHSVRDLDATRKSVTAEGLPILLVGSAQLPTVSTVAEQIDWDLAPALLILAPGDRIAAGAADAYRVAMDGSTNAVIYADDDLLVGERRLAPHFKPDWNPELFAHCDYVSGACLVRATRTDLDAVSAEPDWAARLVANLIARGAPGHLRQMLHHRRQRPVAQVPARPLSVAADLPSVSVIVPTRNRVDLLRTCLTGVVDTAYPDIEVIVVDNASDDPETLAYLDALDPKLFRVLRHDGPFNYSAINNRAVAVARGRFLCLLNNDIEMIETSWLATLVTQALREDVGAVGARLLYPDGRIQHAGVVIGVGNAAGHAHRFLLPDEEGYFHRHSLPQFTMAVTGACLVVERAKFLAVGGLDERNFTVAFNDVDLCLRLNQHGWQSLYEPRATLIHHESVSRGFDTDPVGAARFAGELAALKRLWKTDEIFDPYHHPNLSRASERFAVTL